MKTKFYFLLLLCLSFGGYSQQVIGTYPGHDGGFENQVVGNIAAVAGGTVPLSATGWASNTNVPSNNRVIASGSSARSGQRFAQFGPNGVANNRSYYTPAAGNFNSGTTYQIQFWYKSATPPAFDANGSNVSIHYNNASLTPIAPVPTTASTVTINSGIAAQTAWTKQTVTLAIPSAQTVVNGVASINFDLSVSGIYIVDFDDFVIYEGSLADIAAPNSPGAITAVGGLGSIANVSWTAASGGVDGGGYMVVRYQTSTAPSSGDDPNQNGIYNFNNSIGAGAGAVRYIGTNTSFVDSSLSPGLDYYYKVYTVDKAFNYSDESTTSSPVQSLATAYYYKGSGSLTDLANWGLNLNGSGTAPANFTDASQVFEIRNAATVSLDGTWTVGTSPANGTKVRLGNTGQAAITLTVNPGASVGPSGTGNFDVLAPSSGNQTVIYKESTALSFGNILDDNLVVIYDGVPVSSGSTKNFGTVSVINSGNVTFTANPVIRNIIVDGSSTLVTPNTASSFITVPTGGSVTINGTVKVSKLTGFVSSGVAPSSAGAAIQFVGTENVVLGANSLVEYVRDATGPQIVTARTDYKNLTLSGTVPKTTNGPVTVVGALIVNQTTSATGLTLSGDLTVNGSLSFLLGRINTGSSTLTIGASGTIAGAAQSTGWIVGNLKKLTAASASPSYTYAIGDATNYTPLVLTFSGVSSTAGGLTASINTGDHPQIATSGLDSAKGVNRSWTVTNDALTNFGTYNAIFSYASTDNDAATTPANYLVKLYNGSAWSSITKSGASTDAATIATAVASFGEFAIGEVDLFLGINSNESKVMTLYPNPVNEGVLYISSNNDNKKSIEIFDLAGKKVFSSSVNSNQVDVKSVNAGIYFAKVTSDNQTVVQKIVITKN